MQLQLCPEYCRLSNNSSKFYKISWVRNKIMIKIIWLCFLWTLYRVFQKKIASLNFFGILPLWLSVFAWNFTDLFFIDLSFFIKWQFFHEYPSFSPCWVLSRPIHPENENVAFWKWCNFLSSRVSVSDNCKQSITVWLFTINVLLTLF